VSLTYDVLNPASEKLVTTIEHLDLEGTDAVIAKAAKAFETWRHVAPGDRAKMLRHFAEVIADHKEELAQLEIANSGHTRGNALWEVDNVVNVLTYYSAAPERLFGRQIPVPGGIDITFKEPLGVVGVIVPWNFPMPIAGWGFAPALAAGNTVVLKPAEATPLTAMRIGELALLAGLPSGVFNVLAGKGSIVGARFVTHPAVRKVVFTGSTQVGKGIMAGCADQVKRVTLELGGKSSNIIFADADVEKAAAAAPGSFLARLLRAFSNSHSEKCFR
jgi:acyl-CoA reductase-like NAD-dependent aldehyde dehydrogenase